MKAILATLIVLLATLPPVLAQPNLDEYQKRLADLQWKKDWPQLESFSRHAINEVRAAGMNEAVTLDLRIALVRALEEQNKNAEALKEAQANIVLLDKIPSDPRLATALRETRRSCLLQLAIANKQLGQSAEAETSFKNAVSIGQLYGRPTQNTDPATDDTEFNRVLSTYSEFLRANNRMKEAHAIDQRLQKLMGMPEPSQLGPEIQYAQEHTKILMDSSDPKDALKAVSRALTMTTIPAGWSADSARVAQVATPDGETMETIDAIFRTKDGAQQFGLSCVKPPLLSAKESADSIYQKSSSLPFLPKLDKILKRGYINWAGHPVPYYTGRCLLPTGQKVEAMIAGTNNQKHNVTIFFFGFQGRPEQTYDLVKTTEFLKSMSP